MSHPKVMIVCALLPEARPLIDALALTPGPAFGTTRLFGLDSDTPLCVSGIGSYASASAVGLLRGQLAPESRPSCLNVGVCGHQSFAQGKAWLAHKVTGPGQSDALYPVFCRRPQLETDVLHTRAGVERVFGEAGGFDMEGFGFLQAALRFASAEQCALLKVVSDGQGQHREPHPFKLQANRARDLITASLDAIRAQIAELLEISQQLSERAATPLGMPELLNTTHFSQAQQHRLHKLLQQWHARFPERRVDPGIFEQGAQTGLEAMTSELGRYAPLRFPE